MPNLLDPCKPGGGQGAAPLARARPPVHHKSVLTVTETLSPSDPRFIAVHRLIGEVAAGRVVMLDDGTPDGVVAAPLDGADRALSRTLALSAPRAQHLGLADTAVVVETPGASLERLGELAMADRPDLSGVAVRGVRPLAEAATELAKLAERLPAMMLAPGPAPAGTLRATPRTVSMFRRALAGTIAPVASAPVPLAAGATATVTAFRNAVGGCASAVAVGPPAAGALVRIHSSCITGDVFGSLKCDCGAQLDLALQRIAAEGGVLIYTAQEGRGIGLVNKLRAYRLQDGGLDTVDANIALGYHDDERDYVAAAAILSHLGLSSVRLLTNNPLKIGALSAFGLDVTAEPLLTRPTPQNAHYLDTKARRSGHRL